MLIDFQQDCVRNAESPVVQTVLPKLTRVLLVPLNKNRQLQGIKIETFITFSTTINLWSSNKDLKLYFSFNGFILLCFVFVEVGLFELLDK